MRNPAIKRKLLLWCRKLIVLVVGVAVMSFGGVFCVKSQIGLAPATVVPYTLSQVFGLSFGTFTALMNIVLVLLQIVILRKNFQSWQLLQFLVAIVFGMMVDIATFCLRSLQVSAYGVKWGCTLVGTVLIAIGIALEVLSASIPAPADSTVQTISMVSGKPFNVVKTVYDCVLICLALVISLAGLGKIVAIREGSLFLALFTGALVKFFSKQLSFIKKFTT